MKHLLEFIGKYLFALAASVYLFTIGVFRSRGRTLINNICEYWRPHTSARLAPQLPQVRLSELVPDRLAIEIREPVSIGGNVSPLELIALMQLVKHWDPQRLLEIGTFDGRTTLNLAANSGPQAKVYTLDLPRAGMESSALPLDAGELDMIDKDRSGTRFSGTDCEKKIVQLFGDSGAYDFTPYFNKIDFAFVDGSHSYEYVLNDSRLMLDIVKKGGLIIWHDYGWWNGVTRALDELHQNDPDFQGLQQIRGTSLACMVHL